MLEIVGAILGFCVVFIAVRFKINIGISLILGSIMIGIFSLPIYDLAQTIFRTSVAIPTLELIATISSITFLNSAYQSTGSFQDLAENLGKMIPTRSLVAIIPVIFGVLPVSGGALFSAPLVDHEGDRLSIEKERKAFLNLWFRHIPHLLNPLETALVIASYLTNIDLAKILLYQVPVFAIGIIVGYAIGLAHIKRVEESSIRWRYFKNCLVALSPILIAVILTTALGVKIYIAALAGTVLLFFIAKSRRINVESVTIDVGKMALAALSTMIFRHMFQVSGTLEVLSRLVQNSSIWPPLLFVFVPLLIGFAMGESTPGMTLSLSILLFAHRFTPASACLAYTCMYFGHLISPTHLCFAATSEYFQTGTLQIYRRLIPATIVTLAISIPLLILLM